MRRMRLPCSVSLSLSGREFCCVHNHARIVHGSSEQAIVDLPRCLVQKRIVCFVPALMHGHASCSHPSRLVYFDPAVSQSRKGIIIYE